MRTDERCDVAILGGGMAGLTLARHLLLETDRRVLLVDRRDQLPPARQKVGESTVQLAGYYLSKVLDLEEHLLSDHYMKYNLRFMWPVEGSGGARFEDYHQAFLREPSNIASYQLDRNRLEAELLRRNLEHPRFELRAGVSDLAVELADEGPHRLAFRAGGEAAELRPEWVVDATGRGRVLARRLDLTRRNGIRHGAFFWWVDGLVDVERLTDRSPRERRLAAHRRTTGHLPFWLATNHFCTEGAWFWVIPLQGKTSLGVVYDRAVVDYDDVFSVEKATRWACDRFPLFGRDLPGRRVLDYGGFRDFSYDCARTLHASRWALTGEAGRFSDPLYSPGSDLIALHNTLIVDAIQTRDGDALAAKCASYEQLMRAFYAAYEPSYELGYEVLGDPEVFAMKYGWELAVYFAVYVYPFINDLFTSRRFLPSYLRAFTRLGPINAGLQRLLGGYCRWKRAGGRRCSGRRLFEFSRLGPLAATRESFYWVGCGVPEARQRLDSLLGQLEELARFLAARVAAEVLGEPAALLDRGFVESLDLDRLAFDPALFERLWAGRRSGQTYGWRLDPFVFDPLTAGGGAPAPAAMPPAAGPCREVLA